MFGLGSKALAWVGFLGGLASFVAGQVAVVGEKAAGIAGLVSVLVTALGGSILRPQNQRRSD